MPGGGSQGRVPESGHANVPRPRLGCLLVLMLRGRTPVADAESLASAAGCCPAVLQSMGTACRWTWEPREAATSGATWPPMQVGPALCLSVLHNCAVQTAHGGWERLQHCLAGPNGRPYLSARESLPNPRYQAVDQECISCALPWSKQHTHGAAAPFPTRPVRTAGGLRLLRYGSLHGSVLGLEAVLAGKRCSVAPRRLPQQCRRCGAGGLGRLKLRLLSVAPPTLPALNTLFRGGVSRTSAVTYMLQMARCWTCLARCGKTTLGEPGTESLQVARRHSTMMHFRVPLGGPGGSSAGRHDRRQPFLGRHGNRRAAPRRPFVPRRHRLFPATCLWALQV